jgi:pimeloyl-ACP methyl ester carboxylesterase
MMTTNTRITARNNLVARRLAATAAWLLAVGIAVVYGGYQHDLRQARERIRTGSQVVETPCGPIEYAAAGNGPPVLVVHGAGGGFDQGMDFADPLVWAGFRVIAVSRFGYLRTPLPLNASPAAQADAHACLLDALGIRRAAVVGFSAGAPSSMQFALRHPERAAALVLVVPAAYPTQLEQRSRGAMPRQTGAGTRWLFDTALKSDFLLWAAFRLSPRMVSQAFLATPADVVEQASAAERARVAETLDHLLPFSPRQPGVSNDAAITPFLPRFALERIRAPALIVGAADDLYGTYAGARYSAEHMPQARFVGYATGGHLLVGHLDEAQAEIAAFLKTRTRRSVPGGDVTLAACTGRVG